MTEDEMVGQHHQLDGCEFGQIPEDTEGQGSLPCCSPWGCKESDVAERLNKNNTTTQQQTTTKQLKDKSGAWDEHTHMIICKTDNQPGLTAQHRKLYSIFCSNLYEKLI